MEDLLREIGLTQNEVKIYIALLKGGTGTAYDLGKRTGIYRVHVYDKLEQLMDKGLVSHVFKGAKKFFSATSPDQLQRLLEKRKRLIEQQSREIEKILPELHKLRSLENEDTQVEVFKGKEGLRYFLRDVIKTGKDISVTGLDDAEYQEKIPHIMSQYFRDLRASDIKERVITAKRKDIFEFDEKTAPTTTYRYLEQDHFNPTNTFIYGAKVVIVSWSTPLTAIMIKNRNVAETYQIHFEHLWKIASETK